MSKYTTGEIAKLCGVSVRTVQYYDERGILVPSELSEGGRRLYSEEDFKRMKIICFLREADIPINSIGELFSQEDPGKVISVLFEEQEEKLRAELVQNQAKLELVEGFRRELCDIKHFSVESIGDIAHIMKNKSKLKRLRITMILAGIPIEILQWTSIILWITKGIWWLFVLWLMLAITYGVTISAYYYKSVAYICPECHTVFKPSFKQMFFAKHTPTLRKLTCTNCEYHGFCVETYGKEKKING